MATMSMETAPMPAQKEADIRADDAHEDAAQREQSDAHFPPLLRAAAERQEASNRR